MSMMRSVPGSIVCPAPFRGGEQDTAVGAVPDDLAPEDGLRSWLTNVAGYLEGLHRVSSNAGQSGGSPVVSFVVVGLFLHG
jgi:hypothetical protein